MALQVEDPALLDTGSHVFMTVHGDSDKELLAFVGVTPMVRTTTTHIASASL